MRYVGPKLQQTFSGNLQATPAGEAHRKTEDPQPCLHPPSQITQSHAHLCSRPPTVVSPNSLPHSQKTEQIMVKHCISFLLRACSVPHPIAKLHFYVPAHSTCKPTLLGKPSHRAYQNSRIIFYQATHNHHIHLRTREGKKNQETKWPPNKDYSCYQHIESQSFQTKIPRRQHKNTIISMTSYLY